VPPAPGVVVSPVPRPRLCNQCGGTFCVAGTIHLPERAACRLPRMKRFVLCATAFFLVSGLATAETTLVGSGVASGRYPSAFVDASWNAPSRGPLVEVRAWPTGRLEADLTLRCYRGSRNRIGKPDIAPASSPLRRRLPLPMSNPDYCNIAGFASYQDSESEGRVVLRVYR
jgi:hypothetical protein